MTNPQSLDLVGFLKQAGYEDEEAQRMQREELGLRDRRRAKEKKSQQESSEKRRSTANKPAKSEAKQRKEKEQKEARKEQREKEIKQAKDAKKIREPIESLEDFKLEYVFFRKNQLKVSYEGQTFLQYLFITHKKIRQQKGIIELLARGELESTWESIKLLASNQLKLIPSNQLKLKSSTDFLEFYLDYLFQFDHFWNERYRMTVKKGVDIKKTLGYAFFLRDDEFNQIKEKKTQDKMLRKDIVVVEGTDKGLEIEDINLELMRRQYGNEQIDLRVQDPCDYNFKGTKMTNHPETMTISQYCYYQSIFDKENEVQQAFGPKFKDGGKIFFGVNFEPQSGSVIGKLGEKINQTMFGWGRETDILSYLQQNINGCTNPQFYMKVKGVWTGGHQENVSMCAVNINHGPGQSEWYTVEVEEVEKLRIALRNKFKMDLYQDQGLWYEKAIWFIENGFKIKKIIQKPGDMVVSGPGTLHWVRSYGIALQSAWNIFTDTYKSWQAAFHRQEQNAKIHFKKSNIIPLKVLTLKHMDHAHDTMDKHTYRLLLTHLQKWLNEEENVLNQIYLNFGDTSIKKKVQFREEHQVFCELCYQEIFLFYVDSKLVSGSENKITCLGCFLARALHENSNKNSFEILMRYDCEQMQNFLVLAKCKLLNPDRVVFCNGDHLNKKCKQKHFGKLRLPSSQPQDVPSVVRIGQNHLVRVQMTRCVCQRPFGGSDAICQKRGVGDNKKQYSEYESKPKKRKYNVEGQSYNDDGGQASDSSYQPANHHGRKKHEGSRREEERSKTYKKRDNHDGKDNYRGRNEKYDNNKNSNYRDNRWNNQDRNRSSKDKANFDNRNNNPSDKKTEERTPGNEKGASTPKSDLSY